MKINLFKLPVYWILILLILPAFFSCSRSEPRIHHGFMELVYYSGRDRIEERFTFFVLSDDEEGIENLAELYLFHDREGYRWLISTDDWVVFTEQDRTWIGSRSIAMSGNNPLPRGQYRAVLINKSGERTERSFTFDGPERPPHPFPLFSLIDDEYSIDSQYPVNHFIGYDQQGRAVESIILTERVGDVRDLRLSSSVRTVALWAEDPEYHISALTDAVPIR